MSGSARRPIAPELFFLLSKMLGAAARLYLVCLILQNYVFGSMGVPFEITAAGTVFLIWLYTFRGRHKVVGVDRRFADFVSDNGIGIDFVPTVPLE